MNDRPKTTPAEMKKHSPAEMSALPVEGVLDAPVVYIDGYQGVTISNGVVKMNFFHDLFDIAQNKNRRKCAVVVSMPLPVFEAMRTAMNGLAQQLADQGIMIVQQPGQKPQ